MRFAQRVFLIAGCYGLIALLPLYLLEGMIGEQDPPAITHPEYYYGFVGLGVSWQVLFLLLSNNPMRYRLLILPSILEKVTFGIAALVLVAQGRLTGGPVVGAMIDLLLAALFAYSYVLLGRELAQQ